VYFNGNRINTTTTSGKFKQQKKLDYIRTIIHIFKPGI